MNNSRISYPFIALLILLVIRFFAIAYVILNGDIALSPDEAQYWTWSQELSYGYFSKPPGIAWQIALTTFFLGSTEWGIRFGALLIGSLLPLAVYRLAKGAGFSRNLAGFAGAMMALTPVGIAGSMLAITDGGMLLFWTLACKEFAVALRDDKVPHGPLLGTTLALGALFKWSIYILLIVMLVWSFWMGRKWIKALMVATLFSLLGLLPSLAWNFHHHFVTFRHVWATLAGGDTIAAKAPPNLLDFIGAQVALISPLLFIFFVVAIWKHLRSPAPMTRPLLFLFVTTLLILFPATLSLFQKVQGNWAVFVYPTAIVFTTYYLIEEKSRGRTWYFTSLVLSTLLSAAVLSLPTVQDRGLFASFPIPYKSNPFKNTLGWRELPQVLDKAGYNPRKHYLVADTYQMASLLSFYSKGQKRAYFLNLDQRRDNQFSFWPGLAMEPRESGFFVTVQEVHKEKSLDPSIEVAKLKRYFKQVDPLEKSVIFSAYGKPAKEAFPMAVSAFELQK